MPMLIILKTPSYICKIFGLFFNISTSYIQDFVFSFKKWASYTFNKREAGKHGLWIHTFRKKSKETIVIVCLLNIKVLK